VVPKITVNKTSTVQKNTTKNVEETKSSTNNDKPSGGISNISNYNFYFLYRQLREPNCMR